MGMNRYAGRVLTVALVLACSPIFALEPIPAHRAKQIEEAAPAKAQVLPKKPRRVLLLATPEHLMAKDPHAGYNIPYAVQAMKALGVKSGAFQPVVSQDIALLLPQNIKQFDAIVLCNTSGPWITPSDQAMEKLKEHGSDKKAVEQILRQSLVDWLGNGRGLVGVHFAIGGNGHWPQFKEILGASYWGHPWNEDIGVTVEEPNHPLLAAFQGKNHFRIADEIFQFNVPYSRDKLRVLLSLDPQTSNMGVKWIDRTDNDFALAWVKRFGQGRVFYTALGHRTEIFWDSRMLQFYLDGIQLATGDLEAPLAPRSERPVKKGPSPTPPEVRLSKMKAGKVTPLDPQQIRAIEAAAPTDPPARPVRPRKVLVWGHVWTHDPNPHAEKALEILGRKTRAFTGVVSDDPRLLLGDRLPQFDVLVMNNLHESEPFLPEDFAKLSREQQNSARQLDAAVKLSILEFVKSGKGIVGIHAATAALNGWPEYGEMMGAYYGGHIAGPVVIKIDDPRHPVNACLNGKPWQISDEIYISRQPYSRRKLHVLLSLDLGKMADPGKRPDKDYAISWVRTYGKGRVFYTTLGHADSTYTNPLFLQHLLAGVQYAAGDFTNEPGANTRLTP